MIRIDALKLSRNGVKHVAMLAMFLNHAAQMFMPAGSIQRSVLVSIGYFTAPAMCWFLVQGFYATSSRKSYFLRLVLCALASQIPYGLCFGFGQGLNMLVTLSACFLILAVRNSGMPGVIKFVLQAALVIFTTWSDWSIAAPVAVILFDMARSGRCPDYAGFSEMALVSASVFGFDAGSVLLDLGLGILGPSCACLVILYGLDPERRPVRRPGFWKYYFYAFYPAHLLLLGIVKFIVGGAVWVV